MIIKPTSIKNMCTNNITVSTVSQVELGREHHPMVCGCVSNRSQEHIVQLTP